jgi:hypothetical protein
MAGSKRKGNRNAPALPSELRGYVAELRAENERRREVMDAIFERIDSAFGKIKTTAAHGKKKKG